MAENHVLTKTTTLLPLGLVIGIVVSSLWGQNWLSKQFQSLHQQIELRAQEQSDRLVDVEKRLLSLEHAQDARWNSLDMRSWVLELRETNPSLKVPVVREVSNGNN